MMQRGDSLTEGKISIKELLNRLSIKWHYFLITFLILIPITAAYIYFVDSLYLVRASILLSGEVKNGLSSEKFLKGMELLSSHTELEDEIGLLKSFSLSENTIKKLDFGINYYSKSNMRSFERYDDSYPFKVELDSTKNQITGVPIHIKRTNDSTYTILVSAKKPGTYNFYTNKAGQRSDDIEINESLNTATPFVSTNLSFSIFFDKLNYLDDERDYYFTIHDLSSQAANYRDRLEIKPISRESNLVEITLKVKNPAKGILFLNTLLEVYRTNELSKKNQLGLKTIQFINDQIGGVSDELRLVENSLETFQGRNNILDINTTAENLTKNLDKLETDKSLLEQKLKYYKYIASNLESGNIKSIGSSSTFGIEDPLLNGMLIDLTRLNQELIGLNYSNKVGNPVVEVLELKIANAKRTLTENVDNFIEASSQALSDLKARINDVKRVMQGLPRSERELVSIKRRFDFNDNVYNYLLEKRAEAGIAIASNTVEKAIVDRAMMTGGGPVSPNKFLILLMMVAAGCVISVGLIIFNDVLNDHIITTKDVEWATTIPCIGSIAHGSKRERATVIVTQGKTAIGESFRSLRVNLQYLTLGSETNVIGITSSVESEGKTFCSANLAAAMAQSGKKTIVIDCDLRRPKIADSFQLKNEKGLSSYLIGSCALKEIIIPSRIKGLDVITSGPIPPNPLDLIALPKMDELIQTLRTNYQAIIIDSPPIGFVSEYVILMKYTNANIYVVRSNHTNRFHLERINKLYEDKKIKNVSILLNDLKSSINGYNYVYK